MQTQGDVLMLVLHNVVMIKVVLGLAMSTFMTQINGAHAMFLAIEGATAVQMQKAFAYVSECQLHAKFC